MIADTTHDAFSRALLDPDISIMGLTTWNGSDPQQRFNVYRNNVTVSLVEALRATFPVVEQLVGAPFFQAMALDHVRQSPPTSVILSRYGEAFPAFVATYAPAASVPYLADVARLEAARVSAYHAADAPVLGPIDFSTVPAERLAELLLELHPSLRLVCSRHAICALWAAHQGALDIETVDPDMPQDAMILRPDADVIVMALPPGAAQAIDGIRAGLPLGEALQSAANVPEFDAVGTFQLLVTSGTLSAYRLPGDNS